jgi:molybdopterin/thiamine biosynthesis adenylyltransferase
MRLKASIPSYKQIEVELAQDKTVRDLKQIICAKLGIEPELTKLMVHGKSLPDRKRVESIGSRDNIIVDYLWARHLVVWEAEGQSSVRSASVLLAGAGAIGNEVAKNLAMLGIGRLVIVDHDIVELSNVSRMIFFESGDVGKNKAEVLARNIHTKYPFVETLAFRGILEEMPLKFYLDSDVLVCGLDNVVSRIYLTQIARRYCVPMVDGGITGLDGRVHVYTPPDDACPICMFPPNQYSHIVGLRNPCDAPVQEQVVPSFASSISLVSSILAQETVKIVLGLKQYRKSGKWPEKSGQPLGRVLFMDLKNNRFTPLELKRSEKCYVCGTNGTAKDIVPKDEVPLSKLKHDPRRTIREAAHADDAPMRVFVENSSGESSLDNFTKTGNSLRVGDYLRILIEKQNGEMHESILRLT